MTLHVYGMLGGSTNTERVLLALHEKALRFELHPVNLARGEQKSPEHLARHPFGVVPALRDGDFVLCESRAIARYLDERYAEPALQPAGAQERGLVSQWLSVEQAYVAPHGGTVRRNLVYGHLLGLTPDPAAVERAVAELARAFDVYERALEGKDHLVGTYSLADLTALPELESLHSLPQTRSLLEERPRVLAWFERLHARPAWQTVLAARADALARMGRKP